MIVCMIEAMASNLIAMAYYSLPACWYGAVGFECIINIRLPK